MAALRLPERCSSLTRAVAIGVAGLAAASAHAQRDAFWCGNRLIRAGLQATEIRDRCGEPDSRETVEEPIMGWRPGGGRVQVGVRILEHWTYDRGSRRFPARITVEEGVATDVVLVGRN